MASVNKYYDAYRACYSKLVSALPIDELAKDLFTAGVMTGNLKAQVAAKDTAEKKVECLLDSMERPLKAGIEDQFVLFIEVMETHVENTNDPVVRRLVSDIRKQLDAADKKPAPKKEEKRPPVSPAKPAVRSPVRMEPPKVDELADQVGRVQLQEPTRSSRPVLNKDAPPFAPAIASGRYQILWTSLADLPVPLWETYTATNDDKIYVTGGSTAAETEYAKQQVFAYDATKNQWSVLPASGHSWAIPCTVGRRLVIFGGSYSNKTTNKVSTFDEASRRWVRFYPDMRLPRFHPGVVTSSNHVIVGGGSNGGDLDDIEVLNWPLMESSTWSALRTRLPIPMHAFRPIISDGNYYIIGYHDSPNGDCTGAYKISTSDLMSGNGARWTRMASATHYDIAAVPSSSPPLVAGGYESGGYFVTAAIKMYNVARNAWVEVGSLTSGRSNTGIAAFGDNAIVVIGGYTEGESVQTARASSLKKVELGQAVTKK